MTTTYFQPAIRLELLQRLAAGREATDQLFGIIRPAALYDRPIPERHRIVFYIGHLETFDWNLLRAHLSLHRFHADFDRLFAFGIDPVDGGLPNDQPSDWPSMTEMGTYRSRIRQELDAALVEADESPELVSLLNIAIEHRLMHAETLEYMFHQLPFESKVAPPRLAPAQAVHVQPEMIQIPAASVTLGLERSSGEFGWDNEFEAHTVDLPAFSIDKYKVTNGQFIHFVEAGGYRHRDLWSPSDWEWISQQKMSRPVFWIPTTSGYHYRGMFSDSPLVPDAPVFVSQAEASAYARWTGKALPSETQWQLAAEGAKPPSETRVLWDPSSIASAPELQSAYGLQDLFGTGWEWTSTPFGPFPGFEIFPAYPGYSADFFDGKHFVMKGGSSRTAACMLRKTFRNWFQAHYQYVYAGFRCVAS